MSTSAARVAYIRAHYTLHQDEHSGLWVASRLGEAGACASEISGQRSDVIRQARALWGHFNYDDEAEAFACVFPRCS